MAMNTSKVHVQEDTLSARLCYWNRLRVIKEHLMNYHRATAEVSSPLDLFKQWIGSRSRHERFFAVDGELDQHQKDSLARSLTLCLNTLWLSATPDSK